MISIKNETIDLIVSNELFCDLDRNGLENTLLEFYRILRQGPDGAYRASPNPRKQGPRTFHQSRLFVFNRDHDTTTRMVFALSR